MTIYLLHFDKPYQHARHYLGFTPDTDVSRRVGEHLKGKSDASPLVRAAISAGVKVTLAHVIEGGDRTLERKLKNRKDFKRWCPCCNDGRKYKPPMMKVVTA